MAMGRKLPLRRACDGFYLPHRHPPSAHGRLRPWPIHPSIVTTAHGRCPCRSGPIWTGVGPLDLISSMATSLARPWLARRRCVRDLDGHGLQAQTTKENSEE
ncbi:hypothetical protein EUGRSUZ_I01931 [Eucalyptus grandis]|uniref:Uncharacterized protein n=2 Tax=Eucalyptus grandis TaxID=71139 RepID=A0ACC3JHM0_EUCGR|nr:hypothetical protein EUGRSUZ_I01931 [Eucalyptus grandis]